MNAREVVLAYYAHEGREAERAARVAAIEAGGETLIGLASTKEAHVMKFDIKFSTGARWIDEAADTGTAVARAIDELYTYADRPIPTELTLTITQRDPDYIPRLTGAEE